MSSSSNAIAELFSIGAEHYDAVRRNLVPCFDAFYTSALDVIGDWGRGRERGALDVLDLGAGTGLFSAMVMAGIPQARVHLIDVSDAMLAEARRRFAGGAASNVSFEVRDYSEGSLGGPWDLVISALSIITWRTAPSAHYSSGSSRRCGPGGCSLTRNRCWDRRPRPKRATGGCGTSTC